MSATWKSNIPEVLKRLEAAEKKALIACALILVNAVKRNHRRGFTSGKFVTGRMVNSVTRGEPFFDGVAWVIVVGTNLLYDLFWTIGHHNLFTGKYERVDHWTPAFDDNITRMVETYARIVKREMEAA